MPMPNKYVMLIALDGERFDFRMIQTGIHLDFVIGIAQNKFLVEDDDIAMPKLSEEDNL